MSTYAYRQAAGIRQALLDRRELALIDVREEADFATAHPLFAVNLPLSKLELESPADTALHHPAHRLRQRRGSGGDRRRTAAVLGYQDVALLAEVSPAAPQRRRAVSGRQLRQ